MQIFFLNDPCFNFLFESLKLKKKYFYDGFFEILQLKV